VEAARTIVGPAATIHHNHVTQAPNRARILRGMEVAMRIFTALALSLSLLTGGCTTADGRFDPGATLGLTAGLAALGGIAYLATRDNNDHRPRGYHHGAYRGGGHRGYR
jgi:hypothetical protein